MYGNQIIRPLPGRLPRLETGSVLAIFLLGVVSVRM